MNITNFATIRSHSSISESFTKYIEFKEPDENKRTIGYTVLNNVITTGRNNYYPNVLLYETHNENANINNNLFSPYDEKVMSLNKDSFYDDNIYDGSISNIKNPRSVSEPVFFFIYNFDNYYHFLYDTLPFLYTYLYLKKTIPTIKLLTNYPNKDKSHFYKFNEEFLFKIVSKDDIIIHDENNIYTSVYISTSLTHGGVSNSPPRKEIFEIYDIIKSNINDKNIRDIYKASSCIDINKKLYISRRTWLHNDKSNIGTDYTSRRTMKNETELVIELSKRGFKEIFTENLTTDEKILLFSNAQEIVGAIGGGMANLIFSPPTTKSYVIVSPYFLDINYRFKYCMENTRIQYVYDTKVFLHNNQDIPLYCRVQIINKENKYYNKIGEITEYINPKYKVALSNNDITGFNNTNSFLNNIFDKSDFKLLDNGLNSPYIFDYNNLLSCL